MYKYFILVLLLFTLECYNNIGNCYANLAATCYAVTWDAWTQWAQQKPSDTSWWKHSKCA